MFDTTPPQQLDGLLPMDIIKQSSTEIHLSPPTPQQHDNDITSSPTTWAQYVARIHPWERRVIQDVTTDITSLVHNIHLSDQSWSVISDGSFRDNKAAYSWMLYDGSKVIQRSMGMAPGNPASAF